MCGFFVTFTYQGHPIALHTGSSLSSTEKAYDVYYSLFYNCEIKGHVTLTLICVPLSDKVLLAVG